MAYDPAMLAQLMAAGGASAAPQGGAGGGGLGAFFGGPHGAGLASMLMQMGTPQPMGQAPPMPGMGMMGGGPRPMQPMQPPGTANPFANPGAGAGVMPGAAPGGANGMLGQGGQGIDPLVLALLRAKLSQSMSGGAGGGMGF